MVRKLNKNNIRLKLSYNFKNYLNSIYKLIGSRNCNYDKSMSLCKEFLMLSISFRFKYNRLSYGIRASQVDFEIYINIHNFGIFAPVELENLKINK